MCLTAELDLFTSYLLMALSVPLISGQGGGVRGGLLGGGGLKSKQDVITMCRPEGFNGPTLQRHEHVDTKQVGGLVTTEGVFNTERTRGVSWGRRAVEQTPEEQTQVAGVASSDELVTISRVGVVLLFTHIENQMNETKTSTSN